VTEEFKLIHGDCLYAMVDGRIGPDSVDAIVTDPPYNLGFMGRGWDKGGVAFKAGTWETALRVLKPGGYIVAFGGTRTYHRLVCAIEDGGFEIRDCLMWLYGQGFPKSMDVSKAIDKAAGAQREKVSGGKGPAWQRSIGNTRPWMEEEDHKIDGSTPVTDAAWEWNGWGTALKPAWEPIVLARKPLAGTVAANVQQHGTGALNIDGCRLETEESLTRKLGKTTTSESGWTSANRAEVAGKDGGRWPANVVLDEDAARLLDEQSGELTSGTGAVKKATAAGHQGNVLGAESRPVGTPNIEYGDSGGASRFFYTSKATSGERHYAGKNTHPTVKPVDLMQWLCRLITPRRGLILDPFMGSGSTGVAAIAEGFRFIGVEIEEESYEIARRRVAGPLFVEAKT
jgi:DNA modification methylase